MKNVVILALASVLIAGCGTTPPPSCDGSNKRPVNQPAPYKLMEAPQASCGAPRHA